MLAHRSHAATTCGVLLAGAMSCLGAGAAAAHPHMFFDAESTFVVDEYGRLVSIEIEYLVDEFNTLDTLTSLGIDVDGDGVLVGDEAERLAATFAQGMSIYVFFVELRVGDASFVFETADAAEASLEEGRLRGRFVLRPAEPAPLGADGAQLALYDPTFFVEVRTLTPPRVVGAGADRCAVAFDPFEPSAISAATAAALALLSREETPEDANVGALFADRTALTCAG